MKTINNSCEKTWDNIANIYSQKNLDYISFPFNILKEFKNIKFLEAGSGDGEVAIFMAINNNDVVGLEISKNFLKISRKKVKETGLRNISFIKGDVRKMPFKDNTFDLIFSGGVIEHFDETFNSLDEHVRVLKKLGYLLVGVPCKQGLHYPLKKIMQFFGLWKIGFEKSFSKKYFKDKLNMHGLIILKEIYIPLECSDNQGKLRYNLTKSFSKLDKLLNGTHMMYFLCKKK
jgi:ubiquinone/menaquinone biosynthesis C-methylase UbiE